MMCAGYDDGELDARQSDSGEPIHLEGKDRKIDLIISYSFSHCFFYIFPVLATSVMVSFSSFASRRRMLMPGVLH